MPALVAGITSFPAQQDVMPDDGMTELFPRRFLFAAFGLKAERAAREIPPRRNSAASPTRWNFSTVFRPFADGAN